MESDNNEGENKKRNRRDREERNAKMGIKIDYIKRAKYQFLSFLFLIDKNKYLPKIKNRQCNINHNILNNYNSLYSNRSLYLSLSIFII